MSDSNYIPLSVPNLKGNEVKYVMDAVESEWVSTAGSYVNDFENKIGRYVGCAGAVSCQNGTSGIHIGLILCGVEAGDAVIVPTLTFIAAVNPVKYIGAEPLFMDCDDSLCMDPVKLEQFCREECDFDKKYLIHRESGRKIKAIVVVHVFGNMADMEAIMDIAERYNLKVLEDSTEALGSYYTGGRYKGKYAGTIGTVGVYSFNGNKIITTGGGGMIVSNDNCLLKRAKHLTTQAKADVSNFVHDEVGFNYRLTNLQAALGIAQLEQLEKFIDIKNKNYQYYRDSLAGIKGVELLPFKNNIRSNKWFYSLLCLDEENGINKDRIIKNLGDNNIQARPVWGLIHEQKPYADSFAYKIEKAIFYWHRIVNIPCSTNLSYTQIDRVVDVIKQM